MFMMLAQDGAPPPPSGGGFGPLVLMMVAMGLVWWFLVIRPQRTQEKARRAKLDAMKKGDRVRTRGGIVGSVVRVKGEDVTIRTGPENVQITVAKAYVEDVAAEGDSEEPKAA